MPLSDFFSQPDWTQRAGTGLQAFGAGLAGRDPSVPIQRYQQGIEREERKGNIAALMGNMGIGGNQRALLDIMPQQQQIASLYEQQQRTQAQTAQEQANAAFMQSMFPQQGITQTTLPPPYSERLAGTESGGDYGVVNAEGFGGKYQFGQPRLDDYNKATGQNVTMDQFLASPRIQEAAQEWNVGDTDNYISKNALDQYIGQNVGGVTMTQDGLRAMAHLGGNYGMRKFLESGGQFNPADSNGTRLSDYAQTHAGGLGSQPTTQPQIQGDRELMNLMNMAADPNLGAGQKQYLDMLIQQKTDAMGGGDQTSLMQNYGMYSQQAQAAGEQPMSFIDYQNAVKAGTNISIDTGGAEIGTIPPGYETYIDPVTNQRAMRLIPGGPAEARVSEFSAEQAREMGKRESDAQSMLNAIDTVMNHPSLENILGPIEGRRETFFTQGTSDALAAADQLTGKVFMEAYQGLKGGGQITEIEGEKAQNAIARLQRTQSPEAYKAALDDLKSIITKALERSRTGTSERAEELSDAELLEKYR